MIVCPIVIDVLDADKLTPAANVFDVLITKVPNNINKHNNNL